MKFSALSLRGSDSADRCGNALGRVAEESIE
jgi:hypothetical protein